TPLGHPPGSGWPHDNAMIAGGFRRYGLDEAAGRVAKGVFDSAEPLAGNRLPELFAGLPRDSASLPVPYLGASSPQAWAAASVFRLVAVLCGIHARVSPEGERELYVNPARLAGLPRLTISNLRAGRGAMDLRFDDGTVDELRNTTGYRVIQAPAPRPVPPALPRRPR